MKTLLVALVLAFSFNTWAHQLTVEEKLADLDTLVTAIKSDYGPLQYKAHVLGLNVDQLRDTFAEKIKQTKTNGEYYYLVLQFIAQFRDSHFSASIPSTHVARVGFSTDLVEGKVLIDAVNRNSLPESQFPYRRGDEILAVNGEGISAVVDRLALQRGLGFEQTARRWASMLVTLRPAAYVQVPTGEVVFKIRRGTSSIVDDVKLTWNILGSPMDENISSKGLNFEHKTNYDMISSSDIWKIMDRPDVERGFQCSPTTRIEIPKDATIIMMEPFVAYYHATAKGNIGYLRIPHYSWRNESGEMVNDVRLMQYEYAVGVLEKNTVGLVIDQDHNCGGSVDMVDHMVGMFMQKSYAPMQFTLLANKREYMEFQAWADEVPGSTYIKESLQKVADLIRNSWLSDQFMTPKTGIDGNTEYTPSSLYSKPIVMLIDEMSGSGGDAFPSLMQGYGRAKLVGTRTMGAGGHVEEIPPLPYSQIKVRMTKSLFYRPDGVEVENNGAVPDYPYTITRDDFVYGYRNYQNFYESKLLEMIP